MTTDEMFKKLKICVVKNIKTSNNVLPYMSGTKHKKTMLEKKIDKYKFDAKLDHELGVIDDSRFDLESQIADEMLKALDFFVIT